VSESRPPGAMAVELATTALPQTSNCPTLIQPALRWPPPGIKSTKPTLSTLLKSGLSIGFIVAIFSAVPGTVSAAQSTNPLVLDVSTGLEVGSMITGRWRRRSLENPDNNQFVITSTLNSVTGSANPAVLGAIDADTDESIAVNARLETA
jgi:hypothetical protein